MAAYLLDSSAAVKCYVLERGTGWMLDLVDPARGHELFLASVTPVEVAAALYRRVRLDSLVLARAAEARRDLRQDLARTYRIVDLSSHVVDMAMTVAAEHGLRGYDCLQLASALSVEGLRRAQGQTAMTLVSADAELIVAARAKGLAVENPNDHVEAGET